MIDRYLEIIFMDAYKVAEMKGFDFSLIHIF